MGGIVEFVVRAGAFCGALIAIGALIEKVTGLGRRWLDRRIDERIDRRS